MSERLILRIFRLSKKKDILLKYVNPEDNFRYFNIALQVVLNSAELLYPSQSAPGKPLKRKLQSTKPIYYS